MRKLRVFVLMGLLVLGLMACQQASDLETVWNSIKDDMPTVIQSSFELPELQDDYDDVTMTWSSSNEAVLKADGSVVTPLLDTSIKVTISLSNDDQTVNYTIDVLVLGETAASRIQQAKNDINLNTLTANLDFSAIEDRYAVSITFTSENETIISSTGTIFPTGIDNDCDLVIVIKDTVDPNISETFNVTATVKALDNNAQVQYVLSALVDMDHVTGTFMMPSSLANYLPVITWTSGNLDVILNDGTIIKPIESTDVNISVTVTLDDLTETKVIVAHVVGYTDREKVDQAYNEFSFDITSVSDDFTLETSGNYASEITWSSQNNAILIIGDKAFVERPGLGENDITVILTANFKVGNAEKTVTYDVVVESYTYTSYQFVSPTQDHVHVDEAFDLSGGYFEFTRDDETTEKLVITPEMLSIQSSSITGPIDITISVLDVHETWVIYVYQPITNVNLEVGESITEDFDNVYAPTLGFDFSQVPQSKLIDESEGALLGQSLVFESAGSYATMFINAGVQYQPLETYQFTFDYKITSFVDTLYFQLNGGSYGNIFTQFGHPSMIGEWQTFSFVATLADTSNYLIQIFPGGGVGTTSFMMDNMTITHITNEPSVWIDGEIPAGSYVLDTFGDTINHPFNLDLAPTPSSSIVTDQGFDGSSLYFVSPGSYTGIYLNPRFQFTPLATYVITFDYIIESYVDTMYVQLTGGDGNMFTQFGSSDHIGSMQHFEWTVTMGNQVNYLIQMFPGGGSGETSLYIDNVKVERITLEQNTMISGELEVNDVVVETFGDPLHPVFNIDLAPTPQSSVVIDSPLDGSALYIETPGSYTTIYLNENFSYTALATYVIAFDYYVTAFNDTIYFQLTGGDGNLFIQFGSPSDIDSIQHFEWTVTLGNSADYIIQIFPGGGVGTTAFTMDNLTVTRTN